jgi:uncharacterized protein RhaS with RHS repeats
VESDPVGLRGGVNTYIYAKGNSLLLVDPLGLLTCTYNITTYTFICMNNAGQTFSTSATASGNGNCRNNPSCKDKKSKGPLPPGNYSIYPPGWSEKHPGWLYLDPDDSNEMYGRGEFFIHPWGLSKGCIILHLPNFKIIADWATQDNGGDLIVTE